MKSGGGLGMGKMTGQKLLFVDTETNGLPKNRFAPYTAVDCWPEIIQISWQIVDGTTWETLSESDSFIKPKGMWSKDAERVHQIPETIVAKFGKEHIDVFSKFNEDLAQCDYVISHNMMFDKTVIMCEIQRLWESGNKTLKPGVFWKKGIRDICTMNTTKEFCGVTFPNSKDFKYPKLNELYLKLFGKVYDISGATLHNAKHDVSCLVMCLKELILMPQFSKLIA